MLPCTEGHRRRPAARRRRLDVRAALPRAAPGHRRGLCRLDLSGFAFASWASRIPQVRDALDLSPRSLGLVLLAAAGGSVTSMPLSGRVVGRLGRARTIAVMALVAAAGLAAAGLGYRVGVVPVVVGLFALGAGNGTWHVAMNVEGSAVEQELGRAIMPRFHAGFSVGTRRARRRGDGGAGRLGD